MRYTAIALQSQHVAKYVITHVHMNGVGFSHQILPDLSARLPSLKYLRLLEFLAKKKMKKKNTIILIWQIHHLIR